MMVYFRSPQKKREVIRDHGGEKYNEMLRLLDDEDKIMHTYRCIIPAFLQASAKSMATR
jgi:homoserine O-succinyltransferase